MSGPSTVHGPYDTNADAMADARPVYDAYRATYARGLMARTNAERLGEALAAARVEIGAYDERIVAWLAGWEPEVVQVVIGWIERAHQDEAGRPAAASPVHDQQDAADEPAQSAEAVMHYTATSWGTAFCGAETGRVSPWARPLDADDEFRVSCPTCLGLLLSADATEDTCRLLDRTAANPAQARPDQPAAGDQDDAGLIHSYTSRWANRCGAQDDTATMIWADVTCPACRALLADQDGSAQ